MYIKKFFCCLLLFIVPLLFMFTGCKNSKNSPKNQVINCNLESEPVSLDPQVCGDNSSKIVIKHLFEGLTKVDESGNVTLGVADSFENNEDFTEYTFKLKKDIYWSGEGKKAVTAKDFEFAIRRALSKETNSPAAHMLFCIKNAKKINEGTLGSENLGVKTPDDYTIKFSLEYPNKDFLKIMFLPIAMPCNEEFFKNSSGQYGVEADKILCNGKFKIKKYGWEHFKFINLVRNENYREVNKIIPKGITFFINKDVQEIVKSIKDKNLDFSFIKGDQLEEAEKENLNIFKTKCSIFWGLIFNPENVIINNLNFRKSIVSSFKRDYILSALNEDHDLLPLKDLIDGKLLFNGESASAHISPVDFNAVYSSKEPPEYLDFAIKESKARNINGLTITCVNNKITKKLVSNMIENLNSSLNRHFNMNPVSSDELVSKVNSKDFEIAIVPVKCSSEYLYDFFNLFRLKNSSGLVRINDPEYKKYLGSSLGSSRESCVQNLIKVRDYLINNVIFYPLYSEPSYFVSSKNLYNVNFCKDDGTVDFAKVEKIK